jgi:hypothetical protein
MSERQVKCNKCGHVGPESEFPKGRDFFQNAFVRACPKDCGNTQSPGDAAMRAFGGERPFAYVTTTEEPKDPVAASLRRAEEAS